MISLYTRLADQWDLLFPLDTERLSFLSELILGVTPGARVIEVGCGSGATAVGLADLGFRVSASDLDPDMIRVARQKLVEGRKNVDFTEADMITALENSPSASAQVVLCLGNTLPHLTGKGEVERFFTAAGKALTPGGIFVIQMLNYPRIIRLGGVDLPPLEGTELLFHRRQSYDIETGLIVFDTRLESCGRREERQHNLLPIDVNDLSGMALNAGLQVSGVFMDWQGTEYNEEAPWLVSTYTRKRVEL